MTDPSTLAIIPVPYGSPSPANAIAHGPMAAVMAHVLGSKARAEALDLVQRAEQAAEEERERAQREQQIFSEGVQAIADGIAALSRRLDAIEQSRIARHKLDAASEATKQMLELPKDAPEFDLTDDTPSPSGELRPLGAKDPAAR